MAGALFLAALVANCLRGALPPVDLRAVCFVRAIPVKCQDGKSSKRLEAESWLLVKLANARQQVYEGAPSYRSHLTILTEPPFRHGLQRVQKASREAQ